MTINIEVELHGAACTATRPAPSRRQPLTSHDKRVAGDDWQTTGNVAERVMARISPKTSLTAARDG
jgi:hypothetical protein